MATIHDTQVRLYETFDKLKPHLNDEGTRILQDSIKEFDFKAGHDAWTEFEVHFEKVHHSLYENLNRLYPDLTPNDRRLCAFIRMNLGTKEIAMIQNKSARSIESARYRLKKRMGLAEADSLSKYLNAL